MKKTGYLIGTLAIISAVTSYSAMAADANVKEAYFTQNGEVVHTLSNGTLECVIEASGTGSNAVMINSVYEKDTDKLIGVNYTKASEGEFKSSVDITDANNTYVTMCVWDSLEEANAKTQVYSIASVDAAPENPWDVEVNNKGEISFSWGECEDNIKTVGYRVYKNDELIGETDKTKFTDETAKWYDDASASYKLTAYDEYGNESEGKVIENVKIDNSDIAAILFAQPNISDKLSLYIATGKETDSSWYGYNVADSIGERDCRRIPADRRAVFKLSSDFIDRIGEGGRKAVISVTYFDNDTDYFKISYVGTGGRYTDLEVQKTGTEKWLTKEFTVTDFAATYTDPKTGETKVQDESVNFTIWSKASSDKGDVVDTDTYLSEIKLVLQGESVVATPTPEPGSTPAPTAEPTPEPTPEPTIDPATIASASIRLLGGQVADGYESENNLMSVFWGKGDGQVNNTGWYAYTTGETKDGEECRMIADNKRLVLMFDEALNAAIGAEPRNATLRIRYYDSGSDKIRVSYISKETRYTTVTIQKTDTNEWKWAEISVNDLANISDQADSKGVYIQDESTYFSIWSRASGENETNNTTDYISAVEIVLDGTVSSTAEPTEEPTKEPEETDEPKVTAEPTAEPEPTETPEPITGASIRLLSGNSVEDCYESENNCINLFWGKNNGQINNTGWYAYTTGELLNGEECRKIQNEAGKDNKRLSFTFSDEFNAAIGTEPRSATIRVKYYDGGTDGIRVSYITKDNRYKQLTIQKEDTNEWKWAEIEVDDLISTSDSLNSQGNGYQDEDTHFSIWAKSNSASEDASVAEYIAELEIILK